MNGGTILGQLRGLLLATALGLGCFTGCVWDADCEDAGRTFENGAIWTCSDGCNGCSCSDGTVTSTLIGCGSPPGPAAGKLKCWSGSYWQTHGDTWACNDDSCFECTCDDGRVLRVPTCGVGEAGAGG